MFNDNIQSFIDEFELIPVNIESTVSSSDYVLILF